MIYIAFRKKISEQQIDALQILARQQPIAFLDPLPDLEVAMQTVYNGHADIFRSEKEKPNDRDVALAIENMLTGMAEKTKDQFPKAPPFRFNDEMFEVWRKVQMKTKKKLTYFGFTDRPKIRRAMVKVGLIVGCPDELITLSRRMEKLIAEIQAARGKAA